MRVSLPVLATACLAFTAFAPSALGQCAHGCDLSGLDLTLAYEPGTLSTTGMDYDLEAPPASGRDAYYAPLRDNVFTEDPVLHLDTVRARASYRVMPHVALGVFAGFGSGTWSPDAFSSTDSDPVIAHAATRVEGGVESAFVMDLGCLETRFGLRVGGAYTHLGDAGAGASASTLLVAYTASAGIDLGYLTLGVSGDLETDQSLGFAGGVFVALHGDHWAGARLNPPPPPEEPAAPASDPPGVTITQSTSTTTTVSTTTTQTTQVQVNP